MPSLTLLVREQTLFHQTSSDSMGSRSVDAGTQRKFRDRCALALGVTHVANYRNRAPNTLRSGHWRYVNAGLFVHNMRLS